MTGAASRRKGGDWERAVVAWFAAHGWHAERAGGGHQQAYGDVLGVPGWHLECKNHASPNQFAAWCDVAAASPTALWALIVKRRMRPVQDAYVVLNLTNFTQLLKEAGY